MTEAVQKVAVDLDQIPAELKQRDQWVVWRLEERDGKQTKPPRTPRTGKLADSTDPRTWGTFDEAVQAHQCNGSAGIGFVFSPDDPYAGVDLDRCVDADGVLTETAQWLVTHLDSYAELSPSGRGVHIMLRGELPARGNRRKLNEIHVEFYDHGRYFTFTGHRLADAPATIEDRQECLRTIHNRAFPPEPVRPRPTVSSPVDADDHELLERAMAARDGGKFRQLWEGDISGYPSQSEADLALASKLAFWTGGDRARMDLLFRQSGLMREKWDREDYRQSTIEKALVDSTALEGGPRADLVRVAPDTGRAAAAPPILEPGPAVVSREDAWCEVRGICRLGQTLISGGIELCCRLSDFYDGPGPDVLADDRGPFPQSYFASAFNVTQPRVHQWISAGRTWRRCYNNVIADKLAEQVTEAHLRPLAKIDPAQQTEAIKAAFQIARERHEAEQAQRQAVGRKPTRLRLKQKDMSEAVRRLLPSEGAPSPEEFPRQLCRRVNNCYGFATSAPGCPRTITEPLRAAKLAAESWARPGGKT